MALLWKCSVCERREGTLNSRWFDGVDDIPLGEFSKCDDCGTEDVCPDCYHEHDCCAYKEDMKD